MSKFSLPKDDDAKIDPNALREFAAGAKEHRTHKGPPPWDQFDPKDKPKHNVSVRLNDYHLAILRWAAEEADMSQQKILKKVVVPALDEQAENYVG
jgi:hypothetical protein